MNLRLPSALLPALFTAVLPFAVAFVFVKLLSQSRGELSLTPTEWLCAELLGFWLAALWQLHAAPDRTSRVALAALLLISTCLTLDFFDTPERLRETATHAMLLVLSVASGVWSQLQYAQRMRGQAVQVERTRVERHAAAPVQAEAQVAVEPATTPKPRSRSRKAKLPQVAERADAA